jgi:hypothetical protein
MLYQKVALKQDLIDAPVKSKGPSKKINGTNHNAWKGYQKYAFRVAFIFFLVIAVPTNAKWYSFIYNLDWTNLHCRDLYNLTNYAPNFIDVGARNGIAGYATWGIIFLAALFGALVWTLLDKKRTDYNVLYYWLRVIVRYRAALGIIGFGFLKIFPAQMPYPSLGILNGDFGDMTQQKIYWMSIAIVPWYQAFGGLLEITAGALLLFRKTTSWGCALLIATLGAITVVNIAYDNSLHVYASFFVVAGIFLLWHDFKRTHNLLVLEKYTKPFYYYYPEFSKAWQKVGRVTVKTALIGIFIVWAFYLEWINFIYDPYKQPSVKGVAELRGNYNVTEFRINNKVIPYSPLDSIRWSEVTFEKWTSLSYKVNKPQQVDLSNGGGSPARDINRTTEVAGLAGGRRVFHYQADVINKVLYLQDKNITGLVDKKRDLNERKKPTEVKDLIYSANWIPADAQANIGNDLYKIHPKAMSTTRIREFNEPVYKNRRKMILKYATNDGNKVILTGTDENKNSLYIILDKADRKYTLSQTTLVAGDYGSEPRKWYEIIYFNN